MVIPVVQAQPESKSSSDSASLSLYQDNKQQIENVVSSLKNEYLHEVKPREMFDVHSQAYQVYASLTKLEQMQQMNNFYYKEHNQTGLLSINQSVWPAPTIRYNTQLVTSESSFSEWPFLQPAANSDGVW